MKREDIAESQRIQWIDNGKAVAIILVGLGHFAFSNTVTKWIYSFHLPVFLFLSGITLNTKDSLWMFIKKRVKSLLIPYVFYSFMLEFFCDIIKYKIFFMENIDILLLLKRIIINWRGVYSPYYWYIPALIITEFVVFIIIKKIKTLKGELAIWGFMIILQFAISQTVGVCLLPWDIDIVFIMGQFVLLGHILWKHLKQYFEKYILQANIFWMLTFGALNFLMAMLNNKVDLYFGYVGNYWMFMIGAYFGIMMICNICYRFNNMVLSYIGKNSLHFYFLQEFTFVFAQKILFWLNKGGIIFQWIYIIALNIVGEMLILLLLKVKDILYNTREEIK